MDFYTQVLGVFRVDTYSESNHETKFKVKDVIAHLPQVADYGNDGLQFYVSLELGYNHIGAEDDRGQHSNLRDDEYGFNVQTCAVITVLGDIRSYDFNEAVRDVMKVVCRLSRQLDIKGCTLSIKSDSFERRVYLDNPEWLLWQSDGGAQLERVKKTYIKTLKEQIAYKNGFNKMWLSRGYDDEQGAEVGRTGIRHEYATLAMHGETVVTYKYNNGELEVMFERPAVEGFDDLVCDIDGTVKFSQGFNEAEVGHCIEFLAMNKDLIQEQADESE